MARKTTRGDLATLAKQLPKGELRDWCETSGSGPAGQIVYADSEMLSRCEAAAKSPPKKESKKKRAKKPGTQNRGRAKESNDANVQGQSGSTVEPGADSPEDSAATGTSGAGSS